MYVVFWGWNSDFSGEQGYLIAFLSRIGGTPWLNTVGQYSGGSPVSMFAGAWSDPTPVPTQPTDEQIQQEAFSAIKALNVPYSFNSQVIVATPTGHNPAGFDHGYCAYHSVVPSTDMTYTALPYITDAGHDRGENSVNPGSAGVLDGVSIVEGHELAETITDPELNAWYDGAGNEIGDKCAWYDLRNITASGSSFAVQSLWSNATNSCVNAAPQWTDWANEIGAPPPGVAPGSAPVVSTSGPNRLDVFVRGNDTAIWTESWNGSGWSGWQSLGGYLLSNPGAVAGGPNPIDLFAIGSDGDILHNVYTSGTWQGWHDELQPPPRASPPARRYPPPRGAATAWMCSCAEPTTPSGTSSGTGSAGTAGSRSARSSRPIPARLAVARTSSTCSASAPTEACGTSTTRTRAELRPRL